MLREIGQKLDDWVAEQNAEARIEGRAQHRPCTIRVLGQTALMERDVKLGLAATKDVDVYADYDHGVEREFRHLLEAAGHELDPVGHEIWMPRETRYDEFYQGQFVRLLLADSDAI